MILFLIGVFVSLFSLHVCSCKWEEWRRSTWHSMGNSLTKGIVGREDARHQYKIFPAFIHTCHHILVNCPMRQSLLLFIGSVHWLIFSFKQGCIFVWRAPTLSWLLTEDHVLTSAYVKTFSTITRNAVNKSVGRKKDSSWLPLNKQ